MYFIFESPKIQSVTPFLGKITKLIFFADLQIRIVAQHNVSIVKLKQKTKLYQPI